MLLLDSNILIYAIQPQYSGLRQFLGNENLAASEVSLVEVLGYHNLTEEDKRGFGDLFALTQLYPVSRAVIEQAITLRQQRKMSLGDALIAATCLVHKLTLVTRNTDDFLWIVGLDTLNPIEASL